MKINYRFRYTLMGKQDWKTVKLDQDDIGISYRIDDIRECDAELVEAFIRYAECNFDDFIEGLPGEDVDHWDIETGFDFASITCGGEEFCRVDNIIVDSGEWDADDLADCPVCRKPETEASWMRSVVPSNCISAFAYDRKESGKMEALKHIQAELKAPKGQYNKFGRYKYRSCEDILEAVKPLLARYGAQLTISDELVCIGERYYIKATATIKGDGTELHEESVTAYAREAETKKGMDESQITGTASSYARKYALNGLFLIDDTKDADTDDYTSRTQEAKAGITKQQLQEMQDLIDQTGTDSEKMCAYYKVGSLAEIDELTYTGAMSTLRTKAAGMQA